jgi:hypothetical protein
VVRAPHVAATARPTPRPARRRLGRGRLLRRSAQPARGLFVACLRGGQAPARREAVRDRPRRQRRDQPRDRRERAARLLLVRFPFFPAAKRPGLHRRAPLGRVLECARSTPRERPRPASRSAGSDRAWVASTAARRPRHARLLCSRAGWEPRSIRAILRTSSPSGRPRRRGGAVDTWDNGVLLYEAEDEGTRSRSGSRPSGAQRDEHVVVEVTAPSSIAFSTKQPKTLRRMDYIPGRLQEWRVTDLGSRPPPRSPARSTDGASTPSSRWRRVLRRAARTAATDAPASLRDAREARRRTALHRNPASQANLRPLRCDGTYGYRFSFGP